MPLPICYGGDHLFPQNTSRLSRRGQFLRGFAVCSDYNPLAAENLSSPYTGSEDEDEEKHSEIDTFQDSVMAILSRCSPRGARDVTSGIIIQHAPFLREKR